MSFTVFTKKNHTRYERALARSSDKRQVKNLSLLQPKKTQDFALRHQAHTPSEHLTQPVLDAVSMCSQLKKAQFEGKNTKKLLRNIMTKKAQDLAFSQFYKVCEDFHDWKATIDFLNSRPEDIELNEYLALVARQIINSLIPQVESLTPTKNQSPLQYKDDTIYPLYECAECDYQFCSEVPIDENHCPACRCITHDAKLIDESNKPLQS